MSKASILLRIRKLGRRASLRRLPFMRTIAVVLTAAFLSSTAFAGTAYAVAGYPNPNNNGSGTQPLTAGAYIIDAGAVTGSATKQTIAQGIKPYGMIYALVKAKIPVEWVINPSKGAISQADGNAAADFTFDCDGSGATYGSKAYKSGAFIIPEEFAAQAQGIVTTWRGKGVTVDGPCTQDPSPAIPVFATISGWPRAVLDAQNGSVAAAYFANAEIPAPAATIDPANPPAYRTAAPSQLTACDDIYIMPHADPTYATHSALIPFIKSGGSFYASCHAVSEIENMVYPAAGSQVAGATGTQGAFAMNLLSTSGLVNYGSHAAQGSVPYAFYKSPTDTATPTNDASAPLDAVRSGDPIAQFRGVTDASTQNGSEQIYIPKSGSKWRATTQLISYDPSQADATAQNNLGTATSLLYGPAYGNTNYGWVMYQGGHSVNKGTVDDVASQRAFFNFLLLTAVDRRLNGNASTTRTPVVNVTEPAAHTSISGGSSVPVAGAATGGSGSYTYKWTAACYDTNGNAVSGGSFLDATKSKTTFTAPDVTGNVNCNMTLTVIDTCGRFSFGFSSVIFSPEADLSITKTASPSTASVNGDLTYTLQVTNNGKTAGTTTNDGNVATKVTLTDPLPSGVIFDSVAVPTFSGTAPAGANCTELNGTVTCDLKTMQDEQTATVVITVKVAPTSRGLTLENIAKVSSTSADSGSSNNSASVSTVIRNSGIAIDVTTNPGYADPTGSSVVYTYTVTNPGTSALSSIVVKDQNGTPSSTGDDITLTTHTGDTDSDNQLDVGETWVYTSTRTVSSSTNDDNTDSLASTKQTAGDASGSDGSATVTSSDDALVTLVTPHLTLSKTPANQVVQAGGDASFTIKVTNDSDGPANITNIVVSDTFTTGGTLSCQAGAMPFTIASLQKDETWQTTCKVLAITGGGTNTLSATANNPYKGTSMTISSSAVNITLGTPALLLSKAVTPSGAVSPGDVISYKLSVTNTSGVTQTGVVLSDTLGAGMTAGTATITRVDTSSSSGKTYGTVAWDKFNYTQGSPTGNGTPAMTSWNSSTQGWSGSTTNWASDGTSTASNKGISISTKNTNNGATTLQKSEDQSVKFATQSGRTSILKRSVPLSSGNEAVSVLFECIVDSTTAAANQTGFSFVVKLGTFTSGEQVCTGTRKSFKVDVPTSYYSDSTATAKELSFTAAGTGTTAGSNGSTIYLDDVFVVTGAVQTDSFTGTTTGSTYVTNGFGWSGSNWAETDIQTKMSLSTTSSSRLGTVAYWKGTSSASGQVSRTYSLNPTDYAAAKVGFNCYGSLSGSSNYMKIEVGSGGTFTTKFNTATDANPCSTSTSTDSATLRTAIDLGALTAGEKTLRITMAGSNSMFIDDVVISGQSKGGAALSNTSAAFASALAGPYSLAPNEKIDIIFPVTITNPFPVLGATAITNGATVVSNQQTTPSSSSVVSDLAISDYKVVKSVSATHILKNGSGNFVRSGESVTYSYTATNNGTVPIKNAVITDPACVGSITLVASAATSGSVLDPGESWVYNCTAKTLTTNDSGTVTLDGQIDDPDNAGQFLDLDAVSDSLTVTVVSPTISVTPTPTTSTIYSNHTVAYSYSVSATNGSIANPVVTAQNCLNMRYVSGDTNSDRILQTSETWNFTCTTGAILINQTAQSVVASGTDSYVGLPVTSSNVPVSVTVVVPATMTISSTVSNPATSAGPGSSINVGATNAVVYSYTVNATGSTVDAPKVVDDHCSPVTYSSGDSNSDGKIQTTETWTFTCSPSTLTQTTISEVTASGTDGVGNTVTSDSSTNTVNVLAPGILLSMNVGAEYTKVGNSVSYIYTVENYGATVVNSFTPVDDHCSPLTRVVPDLVGNEDNLLEPGESWSYLCTSGALNTDTLSTFTLQNVVDATVGTSYSPTPVNTKVFVIDPTLTVAQTATSYVANTAVVRDGPDLAVDAVIGDKVIFNYSVHADKGVNASSVTGLNSMLIEQIADPACSPLSPVLGGNGYNQGDQVNPGVLDPGETWTFSCETTTLTNTLGLKTARALLEANSTLDDPTALDNTKLAFFSLQAIANTVDVFSAPTVTTDAATTVQSTSAAINGTLEWGGLITAATLCYSTVQADLTGCEAGTSGTSVQPTPHSIVASGATAVSYPLTGLTPGVTYYFKAIGRNSAGTTSGSVRSFTTVALAPTATTQAASSVSRTSATLNGAVSWGGSTTNISFCYGTNSNLSGCTTAAAGPSTATADGSVNTSSSLTGLTAGTTYYFRVSGTNATGTTNGSILSFTTPLGVQPRSVVPRIQGNNSSTPTVTQGSTGTMIPVFSSGTGVATFSTTTSSICTVDPSTGAVSFLAVGECIIDVTSPSTSDYETATHTPIHITVEPTPQTITLPNPGGQTWTGSNITIPAGPTSSSGLPVSITSMTTNVCEIRGTDIVVIGPGLCQIFGYRPAGTLNGISYGAATSVIMSFTVSVPAPVVVQQPTPRRYNFIPAPVTPQVSPNVAAAPVVRPQATTAPVTSSATRSLSAATSEVFSGFAPGETLTVQVTGSRISGQFVVSPGSVGDVVGIAKALEESTQRTQSDFAKVTSVAPVEGAPQVADLYNAPITASTQKVFSASGLPAPRLVSDVYSKKNTNWLSVESAVSSYVPGSKVYLVVTTQPIILGAATVDKNGQAVIDGLLPLDALEQGGHNIRLVGTRQIEGVSADSQGEIQLNDKAIKAIKQFDEGTMATVEMQGKSVSALREIPLDKDVAWWTVWLAIGASLAALLIRFLRPPVWFRRRVTSGVIAIAAGVPALAFGWFTASYELWVGTVISLGIGMFCLIWGRRQLRR
jgi:uncharacterized repeat protein (TIGR01451 family)